MSTNPDSTGQVILYSGDLSLSLCAQHPDKIFVFGDNMERVGTGGQATIRYAPNAFGVPTKVKPSMTAGSFFNDYNPRFNELIDKALNDLWLKLINGIDVVIPVAQDGRCSLGHGLALLPTCAPKLLKMIQLDLDDFVEYFGSPEIVDRIR